MTLAEAADYLGIPVGGRNGGLNLYIHQVSLETGERRLPAIWVEVPKWQSPLGGFYAIRREDVEAFAGEDRYRGGGSTGKRGNVRQWEVVPLR